jgi:hypothetical protein
MRSSDDFAGLPRCDVHACWKPSLYPVPRDMNFGYLNRHVQTESPEQVQADRDRYEALYVRGQCLNLPLDSLLILYYCTSTI